MSLSSAATALFSSLILNAAKPSIPFGRIKRYPKAWWSAKVKEAVSEIRKALIFADCLRSNFSVSQPNTLRSRARGHLSELGRATFPEESHSSFYYPFSPVELLAAASNLSSSTASGPDKLAYPMLKHLPRSGVDSLHIFNLSWSLHSFPSIWKSFIRWESLSTLLLPSGISLSPPAYQSFLNASFKLVYSSC